VHAELATEMAALPRLRVSELRTKFATVFGEPTPSHNKVWLVKRIAWRLQALAEGGLSERARRRAAELVQEADLRLSAPPDGLPGIRRPLLRRRDPLSDGSQQARTHRPWRARIHRGTTPHKWNPAAKSSGPCARSWTRSGTISAGARTRRLGAILGRLEAQQLLKPIEVGIADQRGGCRRRA
jgi:hypothetical protein